MTSIAVLNGTSLLKSRFALWSFGHFHLIERRFRSRCWLLFTLSVLRRKSKQMLQALHRNPWTYRLVMLSSHRSRHRCDQCTQDKFRRRLLHRHQMKWWERLNQGQWKESFSAPAHALKGTPTPFLSNCEINLIGFQGLSYKSPSVIVRSK